MPRCFVAIELNEEIKRELGSLIEQLRPLAPDLKWVRPENLHITLKFLGEVKEDKIDNIKKGLDEVTRPCKAFTIKIKGIGQFPQGRTPRVIWAGVEDSEGLLSLQKEVERSLSRLGFKEEEREFTGHITLARIKGLSGIQGLLDTLHNFKEKEFGIQDVKDIVLMKSELRPDGARYERLGVFKLGGLTVRT
ncbi:MAG: RNA 2',3'-cyclic phosphodiesterase [Thermodesulfovibrionales bacterium]